MTNGNRRVMERFNYADASRLLREFEEESDILKIRFGRWSIWPAFRSSIGMKLCEVVKSLPKESRLSKRKLALFRAKLLLSSMRQCLNRDVAFLMPQNELRLNTSAGLASVTFGELPGSNQKFAAFLANFNNARQHGKFAYPLKNFSRPYLSNKIKSKRLSAATIVEIDSLVPQLQDSFSQLESITNKQLFFTAASIREMLIGFERTRLTYQGVFKKLNPRVLVITCSPGKEAMIAAAKELSIIVVEQQHGFISDSHFGYSYSSRVRGDEFHPSLPFPDYFWVYGSGWLDLMQGAGWWKRDQVVFTGSPVVDMERERIQDDAHPNTDSSRIPIVITTQGTFRDLVAKFLAKAFSTIGPQHQQCIDVTIRTHPYEETSFWIDWAKANSSPICDIRVSPCTGTEDSTTTLIRKSRIHASVSSTCHFESVALGTPTIILPLPGAEIMESVRGEVGFNFCLDEFDLISSIKNAQPVSKQVRERYFGYDSIDSMKRELNRLLVS